MVPNRYFARAFTLIELLVIMAVIAILITIAYPVYTGVLERGKVTQDISDLRQIGIAIQTYLNDNDQILPDTNLWPGTSVTPVLYPKYIGTRKIFQSPFDKRPGLETDLAPVSYGINHNMYDAAIGISRNFTKVVSPASTFLMAPTYSGDPKNTSSWSGTMTIAPDLPQGAPSEAKGTHSNGARINVLFCDWHVENLTFGPAATAGTFQNTTLAPFHWDPRQ
jgi:prepilin-type processing-associated H-X9-DG protein/prepilin-type N-terminal cleavage/methylation domain-containing protein